MALSGEKFDGDDLALSWNSVLIEPELIRSVTINRTRKKSEKTGAGDTAVRKHPHKWDYTMTIELWGTDDDDDVSDNFDEADGIVAFIVYPTGNTSTHPTRTGNAFIENIGETYPAGDSPGMTAYSIQVDVDGAVARGVVT